MCSPGYKALLMFKELLSAVLQILLWKLQFGKITQPHCVQQLPRRICISIGHSSCLQSWRTVLKRVKIPSTFSLQPLGATVLSVARDGSRWNVCGFSKLWKTSLHLVAVAGVQDS